MVKRSFLSIEICFFAMIPLMSHQVFASEAKIAKQKGCNVVVIPADAVEEKKEYSAKITLKNKKSILAKFKVLKKKGKFAIGKLTKKACRLKLKGKTVLTAQGKPLSSTGEMSEASQALDIAARKIPSTLSKSIGIRTQLGYQMGTLDFSENTKIGVSGTDISVVGFYNMALGQGSALPMGLGIAMTSVDGDFSDDFGKIKASGSITSVRLLLGYSLDNLVSGIGIETDLVVDVGVSTDVSVAFTNGDADTSTSFPGSFNDKNGEALGDELITEGETGVGYGLNFHLTYPFGENLKLSLYGAYKIIGQKFPFEKEGPYNSSDGESSETLEAENITTFAGGIGIDYFL